jgi:2-polyprenyl-3-methyl-5-hydroxy-6-metoxy-1,4-benzoquinol methylase
MASAMPPERLLQGQHEYAFNSIFRSGENLSLSHTSVPSRVPLDIGCGYGSISIALAQCFKKVFALDATPARLAIMHHRSGSALITSRLWRWKYATPPFDSHLFDLICKRCA